MFSKTGICVTVTEDGGAMHSDLKADSEDCPIWCAAVDGMEALILGLATAGYDISAPGVITAITSAIDAISNNLGDADETDIDLYHIGDNARDGGNVSGYISMTAEEVRTMNTDPGPTAALYAAKLCKGFNH